MSPSNSLIVLSPLVILPKYHITFICPDMADPADLYADDASSDIACADIACADVACNESIDTRRVDA